MQKKAFEKGSKSTKITMQYIRSISDLKVITKNSNDKLYQQ